MVTFDGIHRYDHWLNIGLLSVYVTECVLRPYTQFFWMRVVCLYYLKLIQAKNPMSVEQQIDIFVQERVSKQYEQLLKITRML